MMACDTLSTEPNISEYTDADTLQEHCKACRLRVIERQQARKHKAQTFGRA